MLNQINAEWTKLRTTRSCWVLTIVALVLSLLYGILIGWSSTFGAMPYAPLMTVSIVALTLSIITMVQSAMMVTTEYRFGMASTNFRIVPKRWQLAVAKVLLGAVLAFVIGLVSMVLALIAGDLTANVPANWATNNFTQRSLWAVPLGQALIVVLTQGVGWLVRNTAGTIVVGLGLLLVVENVVRILPKIGEKVSEYMPFGNLMSFMLNQPGPHEQLGVSLAIFCAWAVVLWAAGVAVLHKRDA